jgi:mono/diheme cytochrome c family protein
LTHVKVLNRGLNLVVTEIFDHRDWRAWRSANRRILMLENVSRKAALTITLAVFGALMVAPATAYADAGHTHGAENTPAADDADHEPMPSMMAMPMMSPERGMFLFAEKGCVTCHSINGVGGHDATALDAHSMVRMMNPFEFTAKMWRMAPAMIAAQEDAFGEQITFNGDELADIIAFVYSDVQQHKFNAGMLTPRVIEMMNHEHGGSSGTDAHASDIGHKD